MRTKCFMIVPLESDTQQKKYRRVDDPSIVYNSVYVAPPGAMFYAPWLEKVADASLWLQPTDGHILCVCTPGGIWIIDSQASNCSKKTEKHNCWCRHGEVPNVTVDKKGNTCAAGAGSIQIGNYHGFLRNGHLEDA